MVRLRFHSSRFLFSTFCSFVTRLRTAHLSFAAPRCAAALRTVGWRLPGWFPRLVRSRAFFAFAFYATAYTRFLPRLVPHRVVRREPVHCKHGLHFHYPFLCVWFAAVTPLQVWFGSASAVRSSVVTHWLFCLNVLASTKLALVFYVLLALPLMDVPLNAVFWLRPYHLPPAHPRSRLHGSRCTAVPC